MGDGRLKSSTLSHPVVLPPSQAKLCYVLVEPFLADKQTQTPASSPRNTQDKGSQSLIATFTKVS